MHGGKRTGSGRPALWGKSYTTTPMRLPEELETALLSARKQQIPVQQIIKALEEVPMQSSIEAAKKTNDSIKNAASSAKRNAAARQSFTRFTGMVGDGIATGLNYANPVTFTKNVWDAAGRLPQAMAKYDQDYTDRVRADLVATQAKEAAYNQKVATPAPDYSGYDKSPSERKAKVIPPSTETSSSPNVKPVKSSASAPAPVPNKPAASPSPYTDKTITTQQQSPYDINRSELLTQYGQRVYSDDGERQGTPYFDNDYMIARYSKDVHQPMTPERLQQQRLASMPPKQRQQMFDNEMSMRKHGMDIQKYNSGLGQGKKTPRFSDITDDNYNVTGSRYDGHFDHNSGRFVPEPQQQAPIHPEQLKQVRNAYARAKVKGTEDDFWELMKVYDIAPWMIEAEE